MELISAPPVRHGRLPRRTPVLLAGALLLVLAIVLLVPLALGMNHSVVRGSAMGGPLDRGVWQGSLTLNETVPGESLRRGDVITFVPPAPFGSVGLLTRRVVSLQVGRAVTAGDTTGRDPWRLQTDQGSFSRVSVRVPWLGALLDGPVRWWLGGAAALLLGLSVLGSRPPAAAPGGHRRSLSAASAGPDRR